MALQCPDQTLKGREEHYFQIKKVCKYGKDTLSLQAEHQRMQKPSSQTLIQQITINLPRS